MRTETQEKYHSFRKRIAELNGIPLERTESFNVQPAVQQRLEKGIQESSDFLSKINSIGVTDLIGDKVGVGISSTIAGRTNTDDNDRTPRSVESLDQNRYHCQFTEFDTGIKYATLDAWAHQKSFQNLITQAVTTRQALDRIMIGFNGISIAQETNRTQNPLLQDVNKGWLQKYREFAPDRVMAEGATAGKIIIGQGGDYKNLDAAVYDAQYSLLDPWHQNAPDLVVLVGRDMLKDKYFPIVNDNDKPTEKLASDLVISQKRIGGLPAVAVPYFIPGGLMITPLKNLSIYWQIGSRRRQLIDNAKRSRIENYESTNEDYIIEDYGMGCVLENIEFAE